MNMKIPRRGFLASLLALWMVRREHALSEDEDDLRAARQALQEDSRQTWTSNPGQYIVVENCWFEG